MPRTISAITSEAVYQSEINRINELVVAQNEDFANGLVVVSVPVTVDGSAGITFVAPFDMKIVNVEAQCTVANTLGTLQLRQGTTVMSGAAVCAVDATVTATTLVTSLLTLTKGTTYNVLAGGTDATATRGILRVKGYRT